MAAGRPPRGGGVGRGGVAAPDGPFARRCCRRNGGAGGGVAAAVGVVRHHAGLESEGEREERLTSGSHTGFYTLLPCWHAT